MRKIVFYASIAFASGILFVNIYNSIVNAVDWESNIPESITAAKNFFQPANPGTYFQIFSPATQFLTLLTLILYWKKAPSIRMFLGIALLFYISADVLTFMYFHPRNDIMFLSKELADTETLTKLAAEWSSMNWVRSLIVLAGLVFSFLSLDKLHSSK